MKKIVANIVIFVSLFCLAGLISAQTIPNPLGPTDCFNTLLTNIASGVGEVIASLGAIFLIIAGILYLTSAGNPGRMDKAKTALVYAIAGIIIGLAATAIVDVIKNIIGANGTGPSC